MAQDVSLGLIQSKALAAASRVDSIAFHSTIVTSEGPIASVPTPRPKKRMTSGKAEYKQVGEKFWGHLTLTPEGGRPMELYSMFDGHRFQSHDAGSGGLMLSNGPPLPNATLAGDALYYPYLFLLSERDAFTPSLLKDESAWRRAFSKAKVHPSQRLGKLLLHIVEIPGPKAGQSFVVSFAEELDCFPYMMQFNESGRNVGSVTVLEHEVLGDPAEPVTFPTNLQVVLKTFTKDSATIKQTSIRTDPTSILVNQPIDAAAFAIPKESVKVINDADRRTSERIGGPVVPAGGDPGRLALLGTWIGGAVIVLITAWLARFLWLRWQ